MKIKEFRIDQGAIYVRAKVQMDRSPDDNNVLDSDKVFEFKEEEILLKTLIKGSASLYYYEDNNLRRFFYSVDDSEIESLLYKRYRRSVSEIASVNTYKQQLFNSLKCASLSRNRIDRTAYKYGI